MIYNISNFCDLVYPALDSIKFKETDDFTFYKNSFYGYSSNKPIYLISNDWLQRYDNYILSKIEKINWSRNYDIIRIDSIEIKSNFNCRKYEQGGIIQIIFEKNKEYPDDLVRFISSSYDEINKYYEYLTLLS